MREPWKPKPTSFDQYRCGYSALGLNPWFTLEGGGGVHILAAPGQFVSGGLTVNIFTGEVCFYIKSCERIGFGALGGAGFKFGANLAPFQGKDSFNTTADLAGDIRIPGKGVNGRTKVRGIGSSGSIGMNGLGVSVGPTWGAGFSGGIDICKTKVHCINSPKCDCN
jgi:hypothetical protein